MTCPRFSKTAVLALLALCSVNASAANKPRTFADLVGINVKFTQGHAQDGDNNGMAMLTELGVKWVRDTAPWPDVEPAPGQYVGFPKEFVDRLTFYKTHNIAVCFGLWYDNQKAYPNTPDNKFHGYDAVAYGQYAAEVAKLLKASGVKFVIELYNEPHNNLKDFGGKWTGEAPAPWVDQYVKMVTEATAAVKAVDPAVKLLVDDDMWVLHYRFLEKGLPKEIDGLALHPYVKSWPEFSATEPDTSWTQPFVTVDADRSVVSAVRRLRDYATDNLGHTPAIWFTEWGWPIGQDVHDRAMTEHLLAGLIPRAYLTAADAGVETLIWFSINDSVDGPMGLTANDGRRRLTFQAFKTMTQTLGRTSTLEHVEGKTHRTSGLQVYRLGGDGVEPVWVVWCIDGDLPIDVSGTGANSKAIDALGQPVPIVTLSGGQARMLAGRSPLYLTGLGGDAAFRVTVPVGRSPVFLFP